MVWTNHCWLEDQTRRSQRVEDSFTEQLMTNIREKDNPEAEIVFMKTKL